MPEELSTDTVKRPGRKPKEEMVPTESPSDSLEDLVKAGFSSKQDLIDYMKALSEKQSETSLRDSDTTQRSKDIEAREVSANAREEYLDKKASEISESLVEQKELYTKNTEIQSKIKELRKLLHP